MSMNSALSLSFQISFSGFIYISSFIYNMYNMYNKSFMENQYPINFDSQREIHAIGEPTTQVITNWDATRGTPLGQRGATRDKSPGTEV